LQGSLTGRDRFFGRQDYGKLTGRRDDGGQEEFFHRSIRFDTTEAHSRGSEDDWDVANFVDSAFSDTFWATPQWVRHFNSRMNLWAEGFVKVISRAEKGGKDDVAHFREYDPAVYTYYEEEQDQTVRLLGPGVNYTLEKYEAQNDPGGIFDERPPWEVSGPQSALLAPESAPLSDGELALLAGSLALGQIDSSDDDRDERTAFDAVLQAELWRFED
jgi:hypothetical protein